MLFNLYVRLPAVFQLPSNTPYGSSSYPATPLRIFQLPSNPPTDLPAPQQPPCGSSSNSVTPLRIFQQHTNPLRVFQ